MTKPSTGELELGCTLPSKAYLSMVSQSGR